MLYCHHFSIFDKGIGLDIVIVLHFTRVHIKLFRKRLLISGSTFGNAQDNLDLFEKIIVDNKGGHSCVIQSWPNNNYDAATSETFISANVVIDGPGLDTPTTRMQPRSQCGQPGEFIQIPKKYMLGPVTEIVRKFGFPGTASRSWTVSAIRFCSQRITILNI